MNGCASPLVVMTLLGAGLFTTGCATATTLSPQARGLSAVALVSLHGSRDLGVVEFQPSPMAVGDGIGEDAVDLIVGDTMSFLERLYGEGRVHPPKAAMASKKYDLIPEALPADDWSQTDRMLAVDIDNPRTPEAMAVVVRDVDVDAGIAIRHEWWISAERYELVQAVYLYDRCTILMVDRDGQVLWRQTVLSRVATRTLWGSQLQFGLNGAQTIGETRVLARQVARAAYQELEMAFAALPERASSSMVRTKTPPPPLEPAAPEAAPPPL